MSTCTCTRSTRQFQARCAAKLVAVARAGYVRTDHLHALGRVLFGRDLSASHWRLPGLGKIRLRSGLLAGALRGALALSFRSQRVRLGTAWVKDADGQVADACTPADLPAHDLARWLRAATFALVRDSMSEPLSPISGEPLREALQVRESAAASEYTNRITMGPEVPLVARQTLDDLLALANERERLVVMMRMSGYRNGEIAQRLATTERNVRRYLQALRERATKAGFLDPLLARTKKKDRTARSGPVAPAA